jgi:parallel beta-helix repeat protein
MRQLLRRIDVLILLALLTGPCPWAAGQVTVYVQDFATPTNPGSPDDLLDDTTIIQAANDYVAAQGGGTVIFPAGTLPTSAYIAMNVMQDSFVEFRGQNGAVIKHKDGMTAAPIITSRTFGSMSGSIAAGSTTLTVNNTTNLRVGAVVAIRGAGGPSESQATTLSLPATPLDTTLTVATVKGFKTGAEHYLWLNGEIVSYNGIFGNMLLNVKRGLLGTTAALHAAGAPIAQAQRHCAEIQSISGNQVTLSAPAIVGVSGANVQSGSIYMVVRDLTFDGQRPVLANGGNTHGIHYFRARWATITGCTFRNASHRGVELDQASRDCVIEESLFEDNGDPVNKLGGHLMVFRGSKYNDVLNNIFQGDARIAVFIDDRTETATDYDGDCSHNLVDGNEIMTIADWSDSRNSAVAVASSNYNEITNNTMQDTRNGIVVETVAQGPVAVDATNNTVTGNTCTGHRRGIQVSASNNDFQFNIITDCERGASLLAESHDNIVTDNTFNQCAIPIDNNGTNNVTSPNTINP